MALGFGFLKQMNDTIRHNRDLLGKKRSARELYKDEVRIRTTPIDHQNLEFLRARVEEKLKRNKSQELVVAITSIFFVALLSIALIWSFVSFDFTGKQKTSSSGTPELYRTFIYNQSNGLGIKTEYFIYGTKASETYLKNGLKHQNSESYYETGEQFRSALYYYDTLITEVYLFKSGDTIKNFPVIQDLKIHHIQATNERLKLHVEFDIYDGKVIKGSYREQKIQ
jgi:antitoxin component YwqK of YwqJK toxin-antitoxin module